MIPDREVQNVFWFFLCNWTMHIHVCPVKKSTIPWTVRDTFLEEHSEVTLKFKKLESQLIKKFESIFRLYIQLFVGGLISYLSYLCLFAYSGVQHILCCIFCFVFLRLVWSMLPVSLGCPFLIASSVFSNIYFHFYWFCWAKFEHKI